MTPELQKVLITVLFVVILIILFIWLIKAFVPSAGKQIKDKLALAGYETVTEIKRKEHTVIGVSFLVIAVCLIAIGFLSYWLFTSGFGDEFGFGRSLSLILVYIPAIIFMTFIIASSCRYVKHQEATLQEYRKFQVKRVKALEDYNKKRRGQGLRERKDSEEAQKKEARSKRKPKLR